MTGYVYRIDRFQRHDGPGLRTTVVLKGCPLRCSWCDSPETWNREPELIYRPDACIRCLSCVDDCGAHAIGHRDGEPVVDIHACRWCGDCADHCPTDARTQAGSVMSESRVLEVVELDAETCRVSGGGVTFSGGEPLAQPEFLMRLLDACREREIHTAIDTSGYAPPDIMAQVAERADLFLFDLKHVDNATHREMTGYSNRLPLDNLAALAGGHTPVVVRVPLIPGLNDGDGHLARAAAYVASLGLRRIDVIPYRRPVPDPLLAISRPVAGQPAAPPTGASVARAVRILSQAGLDVTVCARGRGERVSSQ
ncbi:MAG: glycyl-radical enzyme activating protein [Vicinamibacterales bacterium]|nr:glycyl-radical enzyme activating protein [Vicinamibacterales bacterium]